MTWVTDYFDSATYATDTSSVSAGVNTYYDKKFLNNAVRTLRLFPFGDKKPLPEGNGKTIEFYRWKKLGTTTPLTALTESQNPNATQLDGQKFTQTVKEYGAFAQLSSLVKQSHIDRDVSAASELFGEQAGVVMDTLLHREVCANGTYPMRADADATYTYSGTLSSVTSSSIVVDNGGISGNTSYGDADHDLRQSVITMLSGNAQGESRTILAYTTAAGTMTVSPAFNNTPTAGDEFIVTGVNDMSSATTDVLSYANCKKAYTQLKKNGAPKIDGWYYLLVSFGQASKIKDDTEWKNVQTYKDQTTGISDGEIGQFAGFRVIEEDNAFNCPTTTDGADSSSYGPGADGANGTTTDGAGYVTTALALGKHAFGVTTFAKKMGSVSKPKIIVKTPGPQDTSNALNRYGTVGWVQEAGFKSLNAEWCVGIWTYAH